MSNGQVRLQRIYLKDASFESPRSPSVFLEAWKPELQVDINTRAEAIGDDLFEVILTVTVRAKLEKGKTAFIVEVQQAGIFQVEGVEPTLIKRILATICPNTIFPYVRETIDSICVRGGFPAIQLAPVNFDALFEDAVKNKNSENAENGDSQASDSLIKH